jgi:hypothetical protein
MVPDEKSSLLAVITSCFRTVSDESERSDRKSVV